MLKFKELRKLLDKKTTVFIEKLNSEDGGEEAGRIQEISNKYDEFNVLKMVPFEGSSTAAIMVTIADKNVISCRDSSWGREILYDKLEELAKVKQDSEMYEKSILMMIQIYEVLFK